MHEALLMNRSSRAVCAIVVNWNGWRDTQVCLRSLFQLRGNDVSIIVVDNGSNDGSLDQLQRWLSNHLGVDGVLIGDTKFSMQATAFDLRRVSYEGGVRAVHVLALNRNFGYAGALNRGIVWARQQFAAATFWLLNNDIEAKPDALSHLLAAKDAVPGAGLCGSVLLDWGRPEQIQAIGGIFTKALGVAKHLRSLPARPRAIPGVCLDIDYPVGASLLVEQDYLDRVGPMEESYFLYYEEMDWAERGRRHGYRPVVALESRLFHKEGASTDSHGGVRHLSMLSERYSIVNRLRITLKFWPIYLPVVWLSLWAVVIERLAHGELARSYLVLRLMFSPSLWLNNEKS